MILVFQRSLEIPSSQSPSSLAFSLISASVCVGLGGFLSNFKMYTPLVPEQLYSHSQGHVKLCKATYPRRRWERKTRRVIKRAQGEQDRKGSSQSPVAERRRQTTRPWSRWKQTSLPGEWQVFLIWGLSRSHRGAIIVIFFVHSLLWLPFLFSWSPGPLTSCQYDFSVFTPPCGCTPPRPSPLQPSLHLKSIFFFFLIQ